MSEISERILSLMAELEMSYGELSKRTGITKAMLQRYATGEVGKIPLDRLEIIAKALGTTPEYLFGWDTKENVNDKDRLEAMHQNPKLGLLFDRQRNMSDKDIEMMLALSERISKEEYGD